MSQPILGLIAFAAGTYCVYKGLTLLVPVNDVIKNPPNVLFFADDKSIFTSGLVNENKMESVEEQVVGQNVGFASINGALVETNPTISEPVSRPKRRTVFKMGGC